MNRFSRQIENEVTIRLLEWFHSRFLAFIALQILRAFISIIALVTPAIIAYFTGKFVIPPLSSWTGRVVALPPIVAEIFVGVLFCGAMFSLIVLGWVLWASMTLIYYTMQRDFETRFPPRKNKYKDS